MAKKSLSNKPTTPRLGSTSYHDTLGETRRRKEEGSIRTLRRQCEEKGKKKKKTPIRVEEGSKEGYAFTNDSAVGKGERAYEDDFSRKKGARRRRKGGEE